MKGLFLLFIILNWNRYIEMLNENSGKSANSYINKGQQSRSVHKHVTCAMIYCVFGTLYVCLTIVFKVLSSLFSLFWVITGLELIWMGNGLARGKEERKVWFGVFRVEQPTGVAWVPVLVTEIKKGSFQIFRDLP